CARLDGLHFGMDYW
nr:immunoglobulin heavy chain junction region [Mus musculus]